MIIVGILLVALLVIGDGATVRNEFVISDCNCNCDDNSEVFDTTIDNRGSIIYDTTQLASYWSRKPNPFSSGWRLSIGDYKRPSGNRGHLSSSGFNG